MWLCGINYSICSKCQGVIRALLSCCKAMDELLHCCLTPITSSGRFAGLLQETPLSHFVICLEFQTEPPFRMREGWIPMPDGRTYVYRYFPLFYFIFCIYTGSSLRFQSPQEQVLCILVLLLWQLPHHHLRWHLTALAPPPVQSPASRSSRALMVWRQTAEA